MKISKLLNKKNSIFLILFFLFSFNSYAQDEPVDIWNIDKSKTDEQVITEEKAETKESNEEIVEQQTIGAAAFVVNLRDVVRHPVDHDRVLILFIPNVGYRWPTRNHLWPTRPADGRQKRQAPWKSRKYGSRERAPKAAWRLPAATGVMRLRRPVRSQ